ncbi:hypothetical protein WA158_000755 [Blastocystis sp. Blastoise]
MFNRCAAKVMRMGFNSSKFLTRNVVSSTKTNQNNFGLLLAGAAGFAAATFAGYTAFSNAYANEDSVSVSEITKKHSASISNSALKSNLRIFSGNSNRVLAEEICTELGIKLGNCSVSRYADGEVNVNINEPVRGKDIYIIQSTCPPNINDNLMELMLMISTVRRASARKITAVIPYYGYARQDRKMTSRVPISAADVARLLESMGVDRVVAVDLHCGQIQYYITIIIFIYLFQGFFGPRVPVDNLQGGVVGVDYFSNQIKLENPVIVSPDAGGVYRVKKFREGLARKQIESGLAMIIKQRGKPGQIEQMDLVGSVSGCDCVIVDDMIDTAGTLCKAAMKLRESGAKRVFAFASHGVFSKNANDNITKSVLEQVVVLNTVPLSVASRENEKIITLSVAPLLANCIRAIHSKQSVSQIFEE